MNTEAPYTEEQLKEKKPIENVIYSKKLNIIVRSVYYTTEEAKEKAMLTEVIKEIETNGRRQKGDVTNIESSNPEGSLESQNRRITRAATKARKDLAEQVQRRIKVFSDQSVHKKQQRKRAQRLSKAAEATSTVKRMRGGGFGSLAAEYHKLHPTTIYLGSISEGNCLIRAISYGVLRCMMINGDYNKEFLPQVALKRSSSVINNLYTSKFMNKLLGKLSLDWQKMSGTNKYVPPNCISDVEKLVENCAYIWNYNIHFAIVLDNGSVKHQLVHNKEQAKETPGVHDVLIVFPTYTEHFFPVDSFRLSVPSVEDTFMCDKCFTHHKDNDECQIDVKCPMCEDAKCANREEVIEEGEFECRKCSKVYKAQDCLIAHEKSCTFEVCEYCTYWFDKGSLKAQLEHLILRCNVKRCPDCGHNYRFVYTYLYIIS